MGGRVGQIAWRPNQVTGVEPVIFVLSEPAGYLHPSLNSGTPPEPAEPELTREVCSLSEAVNTFFSLCKWFKFSRNLQNSRNNQQWTFSRLVLDSRFWLVRFGPFTGNSWIFCLILLHPHLSGISWLSPEQVTGATDYKHFVCEACE